jgi:hypothetical protein
MTTLDWRNYLTDQERETIAAMDAARENWERLSGLRPRIVNRCIQRAKYAARKAAQTSEQSISSDQSRTDEGRVIS